MHKIQITVISPTNITVVLFDQRDNIVERYTEHFDSPQRAYVYVRGLVSAFGAGLERQSSTAYNYLKMLFDADQRTN